MVTKAEGESSTNFVACLCHQHPVGTTDVQMMSCRKGIGLEGGAIGAREDSGQAEPRSEREGREGERGSRTVAIQSRSYSVFIRCDSVEFRKCFTKKSCLCFLTARAISCNCLRESEAIEEKREV